MAAPARHSGQNSCYSSVHAELILNNPLSAVKSSIIHDAKAQVTLHELTKLTRIFKNFLSRLPTLTDNQTQYEVELYAAQLQDLIHLLSQTPYPEVFGKAARRFEAIQASMMRHSKSAPANMIEGWMHQLTGELGEVEVSLLAPSKGLRRGVHFAELILAKDVPPEKENMRRREVDVSFQRSKADGTIETVLAEVKNYKNPFDQSDLNRVIQENRRGNILLQIEDLLALARILKNTRVELVFINGITNQAEKMLLNRFGPSLRIHSGVKLM